MASGQGGTLRIGMGSGPGAMLMTPLLDAHGDPASAGARSTCRAAAPNCWCRRCANARWTRWWSTLVRCTPAPDLGVSIRCARCAASSCAAADIRWRGSAAGVSFADVQRYPIASTPLSDEVARVLVERFGSQAHPEQCVTLHCEEVASLVEVARRTDAVLLAIRAAGPELVELTMKPALNSTARFGLVTLARRTEAPALAIVRELMEELMRD